jgi:hypothetical protein
MNIGLQVRVRPPLREQTKQTNMRDRPFVFVYAKGGRVKALSHQQSIDEEKALKADGWTHTATLNAALWIEHLCQYEHNRSRMINQLKGIE